jgi:hypothetical protein
MLCIKEDVMTPQEATKQLFEAAKAGDTAAARAAIEAGARQNDRDGQGRTAVTLAEANGHTATAKFLAQERDHDFVVRRAPLVAGGMLVAIFGILSMPRMNANTANNPPPNNAESAQRQLRTVLADPAMTARIIEQIKDPLVIQQFMDEPEVMQNLRRLANAIEGDGKNMPGSWADKAVPSKSAQPLKRN